MKGGDRPPFDPAVLETWLERSLDWDGGPIELRRIGDGHSNLTYSVTVGGHAAVLRRPPPPPFPPGANDVLREARIMRALAGSEVPVPGVLAVAPAGAAMDVPFYLMEHLDGQVCTSSLPDALEEDEERGRVGEALVDVLVALHAVDWSAAGLGDLFRHGDFLERQLTRLPRIIAGGDGQLPPGFAELREHLLAQMPACGPPALVHGDLRLGNVMLSRDAPARVIGVLDWELASIGDPICDLGYLLATYATPGATPHALSELSTATLAPGFPSRDELAERYAARTGRDISRLPWYQALALWRLAVLFEYSRRRLQDGDGDGDPYYADPALVAGLLAAAEEALSGHLANTIERTMR